MTHMRSIYVLFAFALLSMACDQHKNRKVDIEEIKFSTTDASELFFKNVRKSEYQVENLPEGRLDIYRYKKPEATKNLLSPALVVNWGNDQAFLILEKHETLPDELVFLLADHQKTDTLFFDGSAQKQHAEVAIQMYNALLDEKEIMLLDKGEKFVLFMDQEKEAFRRIVFDFLRLVELR